jgi:hypothetical protein
VNTIEGLFHPLFALLNVQNVAITIGSSFRMSTFRYIFMLLLRILKQHFDTVVETGIVSHIPVECGHCLFRIAAGSLALLAVLHICTHCEYRPVEIDHDRFILLPRSMLNS